MMAMDFIQEPQTGSTVSSTDFSHRFRYLLKVSLGNIFQELQAAGNFPGLQELQAAGIFLDSKQKTDSTRQRSQQKMTTEIAAKNLKR